MYILPVDDGMVKFDINNDQEDSFNKIITSIKKIKGSV